MKLRQISLTSVALLISLQIAAQDLIYKKNGEIIKAKILNKSEKSISFKHSEHRDSLTYFLNVSTIDSIILHNGNKEIFNENNIGPPVLTQNGNSVINHHLVGIDLTGYLFYRNLTLSYEFLPAKARVGFKVAYAKNVESLGYAAFNFNFNRIPDWSARLGLNYYFFPPRTFRAGTGLYYIFGKYSPANYYRFNASYTNSLSGDQNMSGLVLSLFGFYNLNKNLAINFGFDIPLVLHPAPRDFPVVIRCEFMFNF
jgi:hypothetical protein